MTGITLIAGLDLRRINYLWKSHMMYSKDHLVLAEIPYTSIQGEGRFVGIPMTYVRTQGCNVSCSWCDSYYTWHPYAQNKVQHEPTLTVVEMSFDQLRGILHEEDCKHVWFTGGEPMLQAEAINNYLQRRDRTKKYHICTAGTIYNSALLDHLDYITIDIKAPFSKTKSNLDVVTATNNQMGDELELKMVVAPTDEDKEYAVFIADKYPERSLTLQPLYVSEPELAQDDKLAVNASYWKLDDFANWINDTFRNYERVRMGTQFHKSIWPDKLRLI